MAFIAVFFISFAGMLASCGKNDDTGKNDVSGIVSDADKDLAEAMAKVQMMQKGMPYPVSTLSGDYLAGRVASDNGDMQAAADFLTRALGEDKDNNALLQLALPVAVAAGDFDKAYDFALKLYNKGNNESHLGTVVLISHAVKSNDTVKAWEYADKMNPEGLGQYLKPLMRAWLAASDKSPVLSEMILKQEINKQPLLSALYHTHLGLVTEFRGDEEKANEYYKTALTEQFSVRMAALVGSFYENNNRVGTAQEMYNRLTGEFHSQSFAETVMKRIDAGRKPPRNVRDIGDGMAMALFDLAGVLHQEKASRLAMLFAEVAAFLKPDDDFNNILLGDIYNTAGLSDRAVKMYSRVKPESDVLNLTLLRLADTYESMENNNETLKVLDSVHVSDGLKNVILRKKADVLRRAERYKEAIPVYDEVIKKYSGKNVKRDWTAYYGRGLCYEQADNWDAAEKDLKTALEIDPEQPLVLNYLGYTWADKGMNINLALSYIKKASELEPDDGYIADSMGWVLYRLGHYAQAVRYMEHAVGLVPNDATINDHLGDVYWHVNRKIEAKFQWQRALDDEKDEKNKARLKEKIEKGYFPPESDTEIKENTSRL